MNPHKVKFQKTIKQMCHKHHLFNVFSDFCFCAAAALSQPLDFKEERERHYLDIVGKYDKAELDAMCQLLAITTEGMEHEPSDFLGECFMEMELSNANIGQFYTPYCLSKLCAEMTIDRVTLNAGKVVTLQEPAIGSGGMVLAFAEVMRSAGFHPHRQLSVVGIDLDSRAVHMAFIQLALWHIPAVLHIGNTLTMQTYDTWLTPAYIMQRSVLEPVMRAQSAIESLPCLPVECVPEVPSNQKWQQASLF